MAIYLGKLAYNFFRKKLHERKEGDAPSNPTTNVDGAEERIVDVEAPKNNAPNESAPNRESREEQNPPDDGLTPEQRKRLRKDRNLWLLRLAVALTIPVILETLDYTVVATAQPRIASAFHRLNLQSYVGTVYLLTSTAFLPLFAAFADVYGRHWAIQTAIFLFLIGSTISTAAQNMPMMLAGRGISGIGAAGLLTVVRTILADSASLNANNIQAALMTILYTIGFCIGPVIGGALTDISFRWVFAINLPCCVVSMVLIFVLLRKRIRRPLLGKGLSRTDKLLHIDWMAAILFTIGGILLLLGLNWGSGEGWDSAKVIVCLVIGAVLVIATIFWEFVLERKQTSSMARAQERNDPEPQSSYDSIEKAIPASNAVTYGDLPALFRASALLPLTVLRNYDVLATSFAAFTSGMVMLVVFYFVALFFVIVTGASATDAGIQLLYFAPGMGIGNIVSIYMIRVFRQPKLPILVGGTILPIALGLISMAMNDGNKGALNGFMIMAGIGVGMSFGPLSLHARFSQPHSRVAIVIALNIFFRSLGGTVGLAQCGTVTNAKVRAYFNGLPESTRAQLQGTGAQSFTSADLTSLDQINALPSDVQELVRNAFRNGLRWSFISIIPWACCSLIACLFLRHIVDTDKFTPNETAPVSPPVRVPADTTDAPIEEINVGTKAESNALP